MLVMSSLPDSGFLDDLLVLYTTFYTSYYGYEVTFTVV